MKVIFLKVVIGSNMSQAFDSIIGGKDEYIYNTQEDYDKERILDVFRDCASGLIDIVVIGHKHQSVERIWVGKCKQHPDHIFKPVIRIDKLLDDQETIYQLEKLYEFSERTRFQDLLSQPKRGNERFIYIKNLPQQSFYKIVYDLPSFKHVITDPYDPSVITAKDEIEDMLDPLSQKNSDINRPLAIRSDPFRSHAQRDRDRIIHAKAFRRLVDKAQIYTSSKGDHFRTRMTHTLEVNQIARNIARALKLNEDLTEAIALGHDIGHTPFGHEGERELHLIMSGETKLCETHQPENYGGFKHNFQGVRVVNYLEEKYRGHEGLNLSYQVIEGILKHTRIHKCEEKDRICPGCHNKCYDIDEFLIVGDPRHLSIECDFPTSLEGQIVHWADEIAQRGHDLDDGMKSKVITADDLDEVLAELKKLKAIDNCGDKLLLIQLEDILNEYRQNSSLKGTVRFLIDKEDMLRAEVVSRVIGIFTQRLIKQAERNIQVYKDTENNPTINKKLVWFDEEDCACIKKFEGIITSKVINSFEVNCFDCKASFIVRKLVEGFYQNPRQLPDTVLIRIRREIEFILGTSVDIRKGKKDDVVKEIEIFKGLKSGYDWNKNGYNNPDEVWKNACGDFLKRKVFMRSIVDFVAGMTDHFAGDYYKKMFIPE